MKHYHIIIEFVYGKSRKRKGRNRCGSITLGVHVMKQASIITEARSVHGEGPVKLDVESDFVFFHDPFSSANVSP